jgi:hypothetical protein
MQYSLTQTEKNFLYKKYIKLGLTPKEAYYNVKKLIEHLKNLVSKLKLENKSNEDVNIQFKKEFEKICRDLEAKF